MGWLFQVVLTSGTTGLYVIIHGCRPRWRCPCLLTGLEQAARVHGEIPKSSLAPPGCQDQVWPETVLYQGSEQAGSTLLKTRPHGSARTHDLGSEARTVFQLPWVGRISQ